jgi:B-cell receptor-associated protein 31
MSVQWTLVSSFLYAEILACIVLLLPGISTTKWKYLFNSPVAEIVNRKSQVFFNFVIVVLVVLLIGNLYLTSLPSIKLSFKKLV